jgi:hypothetical protein
VQCPRLYKPVAKNESFTRLLGLDTGFCGVCCDRSEVRVREGESDTLDPHDCDGEGEGKLETRCGLTRGPA